MGAQRATRVAATRFFNFLYEHRNERYTKWELESAVGAELTDSVKKELRRMAGEFGMHFPRAVPQQGHTYTLTDDGEEGVDPMLQCARLQDGASRALAEEIQFVASKVKSLTPFSRQALGIAQKAAQVNELTRSLSGDMAGMLVEARREMRRESRAAEPLVR